VITDGVDGLLSPYGDARALAEAITTLLQDPDLRRRMGAAAMRRAQDFSVRRYAVELGTAIAGTDAPRVTTGERT
jgi:glycosyltransferase involved in cell wall biosynthesis